ncbi:hypothetical protein [Tychonema sp. LEGE 07203]|uniref:hypothetical protein n=1 Tax=Tychonema sp. LEGE 07203 TaxID=1828671 RepID=UPI00187EC130|nr:hypothetical protein [Tychonema sp. LEGE 07203]MBE9092836.1 hypothetical protein [Tychonema sp. LEGE 07203]
MCVATAVGTRTWWGSPLRMSSVKETVLVKSLPRAKTGAAPRTFVVDNRKFETFVGESRSNAASQYSMPRSTDSRLPPAYLMLYFILYTVDRIKLLCGGTLSETIGGGAFSKVYKNNDIFKDFIKLLSASPESQEKMT